MYTEILEQLVKIGFDGSEIYLTSTDWELFLREKLSRLIISREKEFTTSGSFGSFIFNDRKFQLFSTREKMSYIIHHDKKYNLTPEILKRKETLLILITNPFPRVKDNYIYDSLNNSSYWKSGKINCLHCKENAIKDLNPHYWIPNPNGIRITKEVIANYSNLRAIITSSKNIAYIDKEVYTKTHDNLIITRNITGITIDSQLKAAKWVMEWIAKDIERRLYSISQKDKDKTEYFEETRMCFN